jgi:secreted Zn-dependent insulinase-like peptidase
MVLEILFSYINLIKKEGVQDWVFEEIMKIGKINFDHKSNEDPYDYVTSLSEKLSY